MSTKTPVIKKVLTMSNSFFTLTSATGSLRRGRISVSSICGGGVSTPCLLVRTSRFLPPHLTPDNLDQTVPADSSILEMNFDFILENEAILKNCPVSVGELAGIQGKRVTCLATRVHSASEQKPANVINGDDFVTVQNASGSNKFDLKGLEGILNRFKPDFFIGPFDEHSIPMSLKRVRKAVDRNLKYEKFSETASDKVENIPFLSSISGAEYLTEKERNVSGTSQKSSGLAFCDLQKLATFEERLNLVKGVCNVEGREGLCRIVRGIVSPMEMIQFLPFADIFDTSFVDEITAKGHALQLDFVNTSVSESLDLWDEKYFEDFNPISEGCTCHACKNYKRSYVHHLLKSHEMLAGVLLMMHNLHQYYLWLEHLKAKL